MIGRHLILMFLVLLGFTGCTYKVDYNRGYIADEIDRSVRKDNYTDFVIFTTDQEDSEHVIDSPDSLTGAGSDIDVSMGDIVREVTFEYFSQYFSKIREAHTPVEVDEEEVMIVLHPHLHDFDHEFDQLSNLGFAITPIVHFKLDIVVYKNNRMVLNKTYDSGQISGESYAISGSPYETINKTIHKGLFNMYKTIHPEIFQAMNN